MVKNDDPLMAPADIIHALSLLTRLPVPVIAAQRGGRAAWAYPVAGLATGGLAATAGGISTWMGLPAALAALLSLSVLVISTGAMHEDGLADTADGLWGGWTRDRRLEIMKDSRIGAYGVIALFFGLSARWSALWLLFESDTGLAVTALLASGALSRAAMPALMAALPHARQSGLSHSVGDTPARTAWLGFALATLCAILLAGWPAIWAVFWAVLITYAMGLIANRKIGGQTGDILGATQQVVEIAVLFSLLT